MVAQFDEPAGLNEPEEFSLSVSLWGNPRK